MPKPLPIRACQVFGLIGQLLLWPDMVLAAINTTRAGWEEPAGAEISIVVDCVADRDTQSSAARALGQWIAVGCAARFG